MGNMNRIAKWDNIKFLLIWCVVLGHGINSYGTRNSDGLGALFLFIYSFHMPAFIFVSGLFANSAIEKKRYDKVFSFFVLYMLIKTLRSLGFFIVAGRMRIDFFSELGTAWYAFAIGAFYLFTMFLKDYHRVYVMIFTIVIALLAGYDRNIGDYLILSRTLVFYPFFLAGFYMDRQKLLEFGGKIYVKLISVAVLVAAACVFFMKYKKLKWLIPVFKGKQNYSEFDHFSSAGFIVRLGYYVVAFLLVFAIVLLVPNFNTIIAKIGANTLAIYTFHFAIIYVLFGRFDFKNVLNRISGGHGEWMLVAFSLLLLLILALPPFNYVVNKIITLPRNNRRSEKNEEQKTEII